MAQFLVSIYMMVFLSLLQRENMQIEGFFFYLLAGFFVGSVIHYLVAKIAGLLVFNRGWCGWACWTTMVLDLLPYIRNKRERLVGKCGYLRYFHFVLGLGLVPVLWWGLNYRVQEQSLTELYWLLGGSILYYTVSLALAYVILDNREFCKYICPIPTLQKITGRFALVKIGGHTEKCNDCGACNKMFQTDIRVSEYVLEKQRVLSPSVFYASSASTCARKAHWILHSNSILAIASS